MKYVAAFVTALLLSITTFVSAAPVAVVSYSSSPNADHPFYLDTGGTELTDGVKTTVSFGSGLANLTTVIPFVGWQFTDPTITFNFAPNTAISSVTISADDANGAAGVYLPASVTVNYGDTVIVHNITDPAGFGVIDLTFSTGAFVGSSLSLAFDNPYNWIMLTEVAFDYTPAVPTPAALPAGLALLTLLGLRRRR
jgi:hypothetical protein